MSGLQANAKKPEGRGFKSRPVHHNNIRLKMSTIFILRYLYGDSVHNLDFLTLNHENVGVSISTWNTKASIARA